ncbi:MAG: hypothetical protein ACYC5G_05455 [Candidatus Doudnabacteria bacterium]
MEGRLGNFEYIYGQEEALSQDGESFEDQFITFRAIDGINGRFYQIVFPHGTGCWSFSEPEDLSRLAEEFTWMSDTIRSEKL